MKDIESRDRGESTASDAAFWSSRSLEPGLVRSIRAGLASLYASTRPSEGSVKAPPLSTSSRNLDRLLQGAIRKGQVYDFFGASGTGKTQICFQLCVNQALLGERSGMTVFVDTVGTFRPERISELAGFRGDRTREVLERILVLRCGSIADQIRVPSEIRSLCRRGRVDLLVVDSLTGNFAFELMGEKRILERQSGLARHLHDLSLLALTEEVAVVVTNQIRGRVSEIRSTEVELGSRTVSAAVHTRVHLSRSEGRWKAVRVQPSSHPPVVGYFMVDERGVHD